MRSCSSLRRRRSTSVVTAVLSPPLGGILQKWWVLLAVFAMTTLSVVTAQSIIECILGMEDADLKNGNGDKFIDLNEYTDMLKGFLSLYYPDFHTDCHNRNNDTDSTTAVEDFFDTSFIQSTCTCQQFNNVQQHTCRCNVPNATIALPGVYPSAYTTRICSGIATNLQVDAPCMNITNKLLPPPGEEGEEEKEDDLEKTEVPDTEEEPTTPPTDRAQPSPVDDDGGGGSSTTVIAVAVVLVVLVCVGTSAGLFVHYRRKNKQRFGRECRGIAKSPGGGGPGSSGGISADHDEFQGKVRPRHGTMEKTVAADEWEEEDDDEVHPPLAALEEGQVEEGMVTNNSNSSDEWEDALNVIAEGEKQTLQLELDKLSDDDDSDDDYGHGPVGVDEYSVEAGETGASGISKPIKIINTGKKKRKKNNKKTKGGSSSSTPPPQDSAAAANADLAAAAQRKKKKLEKPQSVKKVQAEYRKGRRTQNMGLQPIPESSFATEPNFMNI